MSHTWLACHRFPNPDIAQQLIVSLEKQQWMPVIA